MQIKKRNLKNIVEEYLKESSNQTGAMIIATSNDDLVGREIKRITSGKVDFDFPVAVGHAYGAIIEKSGKITCVSFGPPVCKKPQDVINSLLKDSVIAPFVTSMTVNIKSTSASGLFKNDKLTERGAKKAAIALKNRFGTKELSYVAFDNINVESAKKAAGNNNMCKPYSIIPVGADVGDAKIQGDLDNCATYVLDILASSSGFVRKTIVSTIEIASIPSLIVQLLRPVSSFYDTV